MRWSALALVGVSLFSACNHEESLDLDAVTSDVRPGKRSEVLAVSDPTSNTVMIFGGNMGRVVDQVPKGDFLDETWVFSPGQGWAQLQPADHPSARGRYAVSYDGVNRRALVFGGRWRQADTTGAYTLKNDLWQFDFATRAWSELDQGTGPSKRYYPASAYDEVTATYYVFGGGTNRDPMTIDVAMDLWSWDGSTWSQLTTTGEAPSRRLFIGSTYDPTRDRLVVFAGQRGDFQSQAYNDLYALDLGTLTWSKLDDGNGPSTRMHSHVVYDTDRDRYLVFGGHTDVGDMNDLWAFDPNTDTWSEVYIADAFTGEPLGCLDNPRDVPTNYVTQDLAAPERRHRGMFTLLHDSLWLFGGMHAECSDHLDDTWRYDLTTNTWHELIDARSGESCARRNEDCQCLCF